MDTMYTFNRILCPTDFSPESRDAIRIAAIAADQYGGSITLLHVDEYETTARGHFETDTDVRMRHRNELESLAERKFGEIIADLGLRRDRTSSRVCFGTAYKEIINAAEAEEYSAIALATNGLGCSSPYIIGSTVERVVRLSRTPVLTVRPQPTPIVWKTHTILCPTDFSEYGNYALPYAISIARTFSAKIVMLHVTGLTVEHPERLIDRFPDPVLYHERAGDIVIERVVDKDIEPENAIDRIAHEYQVDLIVIGTHGARGLHRVQIGNTTEEIIRRVDVPVLTITHPIHKVVFPHRFSEDYRNATHTPPLKR